MPQTSHRPGSNRTQYTELSLQPGIIRAWEGASARMINRVWRQRLRTDMQFRGIRSVLLLLPPVLPLFCIRVQETFNCTLNRCVCIHSGRKPTQELTAKRVLMGSAFPQESDASLGNIYYT